METIDCLQMRRPVFFNLTQIQMPVGALTSITHRVSGMLLVFAIPLCVYFLDLSLDGPSGYVQAIALLDTAVVKGIAIVLAWALAHHMLGRNPPFAERHRHRLAVVCGASQCMDRKSRGGSRGVTCGRNNAVRRSGDRAARLAGTAVERRLHVAVHPVFLEPLRDRSTTLVRRLAQLANKHRR